MFFDKALNAQAEVAQFRTKENLPCQPCIPCKALSRQVQERALSLRALTRINDMRRA